MGSAASSHTYYRDCFSLPEDDLAHTLKHMRCWDLLRGKRVFVTGASGFVGTWLMESLAWANAHLKLNAVVRAMPRGDFAPGRFDYAIHAAKADAYDADVDLTRRVLDFAVESGVERFLFTSSGAVSVNQQTAYACAKREGELLCGQYQNLTAVIARLFAFAGPGLPLDSNFAVGNFIRDVLAGGPVTVQGDGTARRSYLYAADLAVWLWTLLLEGHGAEPYEVGGSDTLSILELAQRVVANTRPGTSIVVAGRSVAGAGPVYAPCLARTRDEFKLVPSVSLDDGIRRMFAWNLDRKNREINIGLPTKT